jgi:hypothetical protein
MVKRVGADFQRGSDAHAAIAPPSSRKSTSVFIFALMSEAAHGHRGNKMTADELNKLENALVVAEELFAGQYVAGVRSLEIRDDLRSLIAKVVLARIRAELGEPPVVRHVGQGDAGSPFSPRVASLERSVKVFEETARNFERAHERMLTNRRGASDGMMVNLDELMSSNQQSLVSMLRILATARAELEQERGRSLGQSFTR